MNILENLLLIKQKRGDKESLDLAFAIVDNLAKRVDQRDPFVVKNLTELCRLLTQYEIDSPELANSIYDLNMDEVLDFYPNIEILEYLALHSVNLEAIVSRIKSINYAKTPDFILMRLLLLKNAQSRLNFCFSMSEESDITQSSISYICQSPFLNKNPSLEKRVSYT